MQYAVNNMLDDIHKIDEKMQVICRTLRDIADDDFEFPDLLGAAYEYLIKYFCLYRL